MLRNKQSGRNGMNRVLAILMSAAALSSGAETLTSLREVAEVCRTSSGAENTFDFEGKAISFYRGSVNGLGIFSVSDGEKILTIYELARARNSFGDDGRPHLNDTIRFTGLFYRRGSAFHAGYDSARLVRRAGVGPEAEISAEDVYAPEPRRDVVRLAGIVRDAKRDETDPYFIYMTLNAGGSIVHVMVHTFDDPTFDPASMIGRNATVDGLVRTPLREAHRYSGRYISVRGLCNVHIGEDTSGPEEAVPDISAIVHIPPQDIVRLGRHRAVGTVLAAWRGNQILLETDSGEMVFAVILRGPLPRPGSRVAVTGFPETDTFSLYLDNAAWMAAEGPPLPRPEPEDVSIDALMKNGKGLPHIDVHANGRTIRFAGYVRFRSADAGSLMQVESEGHLVKVDLSSLPEESRDIETESRISVTGTYVIDAERATFGESVPRARGFFVVPRGPDDIKVLESPSWLTVGRLVFAICLLAAACFAVAFWNVSLRTLVERRSREVVEAQSSKMKAELRIGERTRLAADLHDSISQNLTAIGYQISAARNTLGDRDPATAGRLLTAAKTIRSCRTDLRRCLWDLRNDVLDEQDFAEAIRKTVAPVAGDAAVAVRFSGARSAISDSTAHSILNIVRELAANAARHGRAQSIHIAGAVDRTGLKMSVSDDGCGFDIASRPRQEDGHFGLDGITERLERIGGTLTIRSSPGNGTKATIKLECIRPSGSGHRSLEPEAAGQT